MQTPTQVVLAAALVSALGAGAAAAQVLDPRNGSPTTSSRS